METIAVLSLKGGVGKTTVTINLGAALSRMGKRVLIVDSDPQCNLTHFFGMDSLTLKGYEYFLTGDYTFDKIFVPYQDSLHIIPAGRNLKALELSITQKYNEKKWVWHTLTDAAFETINADYDYIIFDCPASTGLLNINTLNYVKNVLIPIQCQHLSTHGLKKTILFIKKIKKFYNPFLRNPMVIPTMFDRRDGHANMMMSELRNLHHALMSDTVIRYNVSLSQAAYYHKTIFEYKPKSRGGEDFINLGKEIITNYADKKDEWSEEKKSKSIINTFQKKFV